MGKNYNLLLIEDEEMQDTKYSSKALQLTPKSDRRITNKYDRACKEQREQRRKENLKAVFSTPEEVTSKEENTREYDIYKRKIEKTEKKLKINVVYQKEESDVVYRQVDRKPIRLIPTMHQQIVDFYSRASFLLMKKQEEKIPAKETRNQELSFAKPERQEEMDMVMPQEDVMPSMEEEKTQKIETEKLSKLEEKEIKTPEIPISDVTPVKEEKEEENSIDFDFDLEKRMTAALEEAVKKPKEPKKEERKPIFEEKNDWEEEEVSSKKSSDIKALKERYIKMRQELQEQRDNMEKARIEKEKIEREKKKAERANSEAINKLVEFTKVQQEEIDKNSRLISEMNKTIREESATVEKINQETEDLLALPLTEENEDYGFGRKVA